jgi:hypothetical protein
VNQNIKRFQLVVQSPQLELLLVLLQELLLLLGPLLELPQLALLLVQELLQLLLL